MTNYSKLRHKKLLCGTVKDARKKHDDRVHARWIHERKTTFVPIELGEEDQTIVCGLAYKDRPRVQRWVSPAPDNKAPHYAWRDKNWKQPAWRVAEIDNGSYSRNCRYRKINYAPTVTSYAYAISTILIATIWDKHYRYKAPVGWQYGVDSLGVYVIRKTEKRERFKYHLNSDDVRRGLAAIRKSAIAHEAIQREQIKAERVRKREDKVSDRVIKKVGVWVTFADSCKAGNCRSGTISWGRTHGLEHTKRYPLKLIERLSKTHPSVNRVIDEAVARTRREIAAGYCKLS